MPAQRMEAPITIREAVLSVQSHDYLLPSIQREFVWSAQQTEDLFDSLMRGYPLGSFLFWRVLPENSKKYRFYEFLQSFDAFESSRLKPYEIAVPRELTLVLDGQQRLTSLTMGLLGYRAERVAYGRAGSRDAYPKKRLYLNLACPFARDEELDREYDFRFLTDGEATLRTETANWFLVRNALDYARGSTLDFGKMMKDGLAKGLSSWGGDTLGKLCEVLLTSDVIHFFREEEQSLSHVLNVFVRLNKGGTKLSYSDLLLSVASAQWKTDAREAIYGLVDSLNRFGERFKFDKDFVLKSSLVLTDRPEIGFSPDNFDKENTEAIENEWDRSVRDPLMRAVELAASLGYNEKTLTSANVLIPVAYYLRRLASPADFHVHPRYAQDRKRIRKWLVVSLLKQAFSAKTDTILSAVRKAVGAADLTVGFPLDAIEAALRPHQVSLRFSPEDLEMLANVEYGRRETFSVLAALYPALNMGFSFHIDHVFPRSGFYVQKLRQASVPEVKVQLYQTLFNQLPNLQLLEGVANVDKLAKPFDEWTNKMRMDPDQRAWERYRAENAVPDIDNCLLSYAIGDFDRFFAERRKLLLDRLKAALSFDEVSEPLHATAAKPVL